LIVRGAVLRFPSLRIASKSESSSASLTPASRTIRRICHAFHREGKSLRERIFFEWLKQSARRTVETLKVAQSLAVLRDLLLSAVNEDREKFAGLAKQYIQERKKSFAQISSDDHKYLSFQLWPEGIARYTEIKAAEAAAHYEPTAAYAALADFEPFPSYAARTRTRDWFRLFFSQESIS
jgi:hypothetical protein